MSSSNTWIPAGLRHRHHDGGSAGLSRRGALRALGLGLAVAGLVSGLAGCGGGGFQPLYGSLGNGGSVENRLAQLEIASIPGRAGQRIRNDLIFKVHGGASPQPARYKLEIAIKESSTTTLVLQNGNSAGQIYQIDARFQLIDVASKRVLLQGNSQARATSERFTNVFSNVRSADDAQERAAKTIATDLKARIAGFLSTVET